MPSLNMVRCRPRSHDQVLQDAIKDCPAFAALHAQYLLAIALLEQVLGFSLPYVRNIKASAIG